MPNSTQCLNLPCLPSMMDILLSKRSVQHCLTSLKCVPPLCDAVKLSNHWAVRRLLRRSGIDVNLGWEQPPLLIAARIGDKQIARDLLGAGANINARDTRGSTVILESTKGGHLGLLALFLSIPRSTLIQGMKVDEHHSGGRRIMDINMYSSTCSITRGRGKTFLTIRQTSPESSMITTQFTCLLSGLLCKGIGLGELGDVTP